VISNVIGALPQALEFTSFKCKGKAVMKKQQEEK
jgi:hypothetical protein